MRHPFRQVALYLVFLCVAVVPLVLPLATFAHPRLDETLPPVLAEGEEVIRDRFGNPVQQEGQKYNYEAQGDSFHRIAVGADHTPLWSERLPTNPFASVTPPAPATEYVPLVREAGSPNPYLAETWVNSMWGNGIGASRFSVLDLDHDGEVEIIAAGGYGFGNNKYWYILSRFHETDSLQDYVQEWASHEYLGTYVRRVVVADVEGMGDYRIFVGLQNGTVEVYDAITRERLASFSTGMTTLAALAVGNADGDAGLEIVAGGSKVAIFDALTYAEEWQSASYGATDIVLGNVDADPAPEIVTPERVVDGVTHAQEWSNAFGYKLQLADLDGDGMSEIIGIQEWYWLRVYDADTRTIKWEHRASLDLDALHVGDIDNDGVQEILYGDGQWGAIRCYDGVTFQREWVITNPLHGVTDIAFGDVDGDGQTEVIWGGDWSSTDVDRLIVGDVQSRTTEWIGTTSDAPYNALQAGDPDADGAQEIVVGTESGHLILYDPVSRLPDEFIRSYVAAYDLALTDVNSDTVLDILVAGRVSGYDGQIAAYDARTEQRLWESPRITGALFSALAVGDVDGDGNLEIIGGQQRETTGASGTHVRVYDLQSRQEEWRTADLGTWASVYNVEVVNVDGDANPELLFSVDGGNAYLYDGVTHLQEWRSSFTGVKAVTMLDADADGSDEIVVGRSNGQLLALNPQTRATEWTLTASTSAIHAVRLAEMGRYGEPELIIADNTHLLIYDALTRQLLWESTPGDTQLGYRQKLVVGNLDGDLQDEVVVGGLPTFSLWGYDLRPYRGGLSVTPPFARPGDRLDYTLRLDNLVAQSVTLSATQSLPASTQYISGSLQVSSGVGQVNGGQVSWDTTLTAGERSTLTLGVLIDPTALDGTHLVSTAHYTSGGFLQNGRATAVVDALPPTSAIVSPAPSALLTGATFTITGSATDSTSGPARVEVRINDGPWQLATGATAWHYVWTLPNTDGAFTIQSRAIDRVGWVETPSAGVTVWVDNLSPRLLATTPAHTHQQVALDQPLILTFSEPILSDTLAFTCAPDPGDWQMSASQQGETITLTHTLLLPDEVYDCQITAAEDRAGHPLSAGPAPNPWSFTTATPYSLTNEVSAPFVLPGERLDYTISIDNTASYALPVLVTDTLPAHTTLITGSVGVSAGTIEIVGDEIRWNVSAPSGETAFLTFGVLVDEATPEGLTLVNHAAYNVNGRRESRQSSTVLDNSAPTSALTDPLPAARLSGERYTLRGTASDAISGVARVEVQVDGGPWQLATGTEQWSYSWLLPQSDGPITLRTRAWDQVGLVQEVPSSTVVWVDTIAPTLVSLSPLPDSDGVALNHPLVLSFSEPVVSDTLSVACLPLPGEWSVQASDDQRTFTLSHPLFVPNEQYTCHAMVEDLSGHPLAAGSIPNPWQFATAQPYATEASVSHAFALPGARLDYTVQVENLASHPLPVTVTDTLPAHTALLPESLTVSAGTVAVVGTHLVWTVELPAGQAATLTFGVQVAAAAPEGTVLLNQATYDVNGRLDTLTNSTMVDSLAPLSTIVTPSAGDLLSGESYTISGLATDGGAGVERVEISINGGPWQPASGTTAWQYEWVLPQTDTLVTIQSRATDRAGRVEADQAGVAVRVDNLAPTLVTTTPAHQSHGVALSSPLVLTFSEPIRLASLSVGCTPDPGGWAMAVSNEGRTVTLSHAPFAAAQSHNCQVLAAEDLAGHALAGGTTPNPWQFITEQAAASLRVYLPFLSRSGLEWPRETAP